MILIRGNDSLAVDLAAELTSLGFRARATEPDAPATTILEIAHAPSSAGVVRIAPDGPESLLERALRALPLDFDALAPYCEGESKILRLWTDRVVVQRLKPTVYSFTVNRYGIAEGTDDIRARFTAEVFRRMERLNGEWDPRPRSAFLAQVGPLIVERLVESCNLEVRIKRYHIGSPVHRYRYTEKHPTQSGPPLGRWARFEKPIVCFDWRHPLRDDEGRTLADEPLPDDYAALWIADVPRAKALASSTFLWLESLFAAAGITLIDMCLFIDASGEVIYGEISPDCMRVRLGTGAPEDGQPLDKDLWRQGRTAGEVRERYQLLTDRIFGITTGG